MSNEEYYTTRGLGQRRTILDGLVLNALQNGLNKGDDLMSIRFALEESINNYIKGQDSQITNYIESYLTPNDVKSIVDHDGGTALYINDLVNELDNKKRLETNEHQQNISLESKIDLFEQAFHTTILKNNYNEFQAKQVFNKMLNREFNVITRENQLRNKLSNLSEVDINNILIVNSGGQNLETAKETYFTTLYEKVLEANKQL